MTNEEAQIIIGNIPVYGDECYSIAEYQEAKTMAIQALSDSLKEWKFYYDHGYAQAKRDLSKNKGEWIADEEIDVDDDGRVAVYCSKCGEIHGYDKPNFCPNCGADMRW